jgi:MFS family permease
VEKINLAVRPSPFLPLPYASSGRLTGPPLWSSYLSIAVLNISPAQVTVYMILQGISPSFFGAICDVLGRRPVYILTFIMCASSFSPAPL